MKDRPAPLVDLFGGGATRASETLDRLDEQIAKAAGRCVLTEQGLQVTIAVPATVSPKLHQKERYGSPGWIASFGRRSRVEGTFGLLKNPNTGSIKRGWTHQVGLAKTTLLLAIAVTASNLRQLLIWASTNR